MLMAEGRAKERRKGDQALAARASLKGTGSRKSKNKFTYSIHQLMKILPRQMPPVSKYKAPSTLDTTARL